MKRIWYLSILIEHNSKCNFRLCKCIAMLFNFKSCPWYLINDIIDLLLINFVYVHVNVQTLWVIQLTFLLLPNLVPYLVWWAMAAILNFLGWLLIIPLTKNFLLPEKNVVLIVVIVVLLLAYSTAVLVLFSDAVPVLSTSMALNGAESLPCVYGCLLFLSR